MGGAKRFPFRGAAILRGGISLVAALLAASPPKSRAEGISGYLEYNYSRSESKSTDASGLQSRSESDFFYQSYNLTLDKRIFPTLKFLASGTFKRTDGTSESGGAESERTAKSIRSFVSLGLKTPLYRGDVVFSRNEERSKATGSSSLTTIRDLASTSFHWTPDRYPDLKLQYSRDHLYDEDRAFLDTVADTFLVSSNYKPVAPMRLYYRGSYRDSDLRASGVRSEEISHNARVSYSDSWARRVNFGADYNIRHRIFDTEVRGTGEIGVQVYPFFGLSELSNTPDNVALLTNPALIDGVFTAGSGINLGLPPPGGDARSRNLGLDFAVATEINTLYVWVDRDVSQVADAFSWRIYTSGDNRSWVLRQTVSPAIYSPAYNRFEIRFATVRDRYVKVVTHPLAPGVPFASSFPDIQVTELTAEIRRPAAEIAGRRTSTYQTGSLDLRAILLESIGLTYDLSYFFSKRDSEDLAYTASTGLSFFRQFNRVLSGNGRVAAEYGENQRGTHDALLCSVSVSAVPVPTWTQSLTVSWRNSGDDGERSSEASLLVYNNARIYEGIDANLSAAISLREDDAGWRNRTSQVAGGVTFVPNSKMTLSLYYNGSTTVTSGGELPGDRETYTRAGEVDLSITPVQTMSLFGSFRMEHASSVPRKEILNYSLSWSPFPDGTLHFNFLFNETIQSDDTKTRSVGPGLRWYFMPRAYMTLSYQNSRSAVQTQKSSGDTYSGTVRVNF